MTKPCKSSVQMNLNWKFVTLRMTLFKIFLIIHVLIFKANEYYIVIFCISSLGPETRDKVTLTRKRSKNDY